MVLRSDVPEIKVVIGLSEQVRHDWYALNSNKSCIISVVLIGNLLIVILRKHVKADTAQN